MILVFSILLIYQSSVSRLKFENVKRCFFWLHSDNNILIVNGGLADVGSYGITFFYDANIFYSDVHFDTCR